MMTHSDLPNFITNPNADIYLSDNYLVLDFETTNLDKGSAYNKDNNLISGVWKYQGKYKVIRGNETKYDKLLEDIEKADFIIAHNAKFELAWLARCGLDLTKIIIYDTQLAEYVFLGNRRASLDLDSVLARYNLGGKVKLVSYLIKAGVCPSEIPMNWLIPYNIEDVAGAENLFLEQRKKLKELNLLRVLYSRCLLTPVLADIEQHGMCLDPDRVVPIYRKLNLEYQKITTRLNELTGGINPNSSKQVAEFLYDVLKFEELKTNNGKVKRTAAGNRLTDAETILTLKPKNKKQELFLELKKKQSWYEAKLTKAIKKFYECLSDETHPCILHAKFNQAVTQTHRLSSSGLKYKVQFQNFDREFKPIFHARNENWSIGESDYAQLEFREAGELSGDDVVISSILNKEDVHSFTASKLFKNELIKEHGSMPSVEEIKEKYGYWRQEAKPLTFKPLYGGEYGTPEQMEYFKAFRDKYPVLSAVQESWVNEVLSTGKLVMPTGFIFHWPGTFINKYGLINNKRNIYNYPIQQFATADIVPMGVVCLWHRLKLNNARTFLVNTIHDSAIAEVAPQEEDLYEYLSNQAFVTDVCNYFKNHYNIELKVPLETEVKISRNWNDSKEWQDKWLNSENINDRNS